MSDFQKPVGPEDPYEKIRISGIGQKKSEDEEKYTVEKKDEKNFFIGAILFLFKKITDLFSKEPEKKEKAFPSSVKAFKDSLEKLAKIDIYEDAEYLKEISSSWKDFISSYTENYLKIEKHLPEIDSLIKEIEEYKCDQEYSLGYYLDNYQKENWHPFPFITLLKELKNEHEAKKSTPVFQKALKKEIQTTASYLEKWISILNHYL